MAESSIPILVSIEGNIGAGKSSFLHALKKAAGTELHGRQIIFLQEPVDEWQNIKDKNGIDILTKFYGNQEEYAFKFQMMAYISRQAMVRKAMRENPNSIIISERCVFTDRNVFAKMLFEDGKIDDIEHKIYTNWFDEFANETKYNGHVYLRATPQTCFERVKKRNRNGETIPIEYLTNCHDNHDIWLTQIGSTLVLNGDIDCMIDILEYDNLAEKTIDYIKTIVFCKEMKEMKKK